MYVIIIYLFVWTVYDVLRQKYRIPFRLQYASHHFLYFSTAKSTKYST